MKILNLGSLNIDYVYYVDHFVRPGETLPSHAYLRNPGGKGLNQSIALGFAGARVSHAGRTGREGLFLKEVLESAGVETQLISLSELPAGHAIIQVNSSGENAILVYGGANQDISKREVDAALSRFNSGDWFLLQNETNQVAYALEKAAARGLRIIFNASPMSSEVSSYPLQLVDILIMNEVEAAQLSGAVDFNEIVKELRRKFPKAAVLLTLGAHGCKYADPALAFSRPAESVTVVDTTAAGDTFIGYFLASLAENRDPRIAADRASRAAAVCVSRHGAARSIPRREEVRW